jgi:cytochrome c-type biogenesis protein CcmH/NrfG
METHYNLGVALQARGRLDDAIDCYQKAVSLKPDSVAAHYNLGTAFDAQGKLDEAVASYRKVLELRPDFTGTLTNLGNALQAQGKSDEAADCYRKTLALDPTNAAAYNNLGNVLSEGGLNGAALASYRRALELEETPELKANFALCIRKIDSIEADAGLRRLLTRAMAESWARPSDLAKASIGLIRADPVIRECIERASQAWPARLGAQTLYGPAGLTACANDFLLLDLLESAQVCDLALERFLTTARHAMVDAAMEAARDGLDDKVLAFYCAIARQCFINEFVFSSTESESSRASGLRDRLVAALQSGDAVSALSVAATASYFPLSSLPRAATLQDRSWPAPVAALLRQQIAEPLEEQRCRDAIRRLTAVDDATSGVVQRQYEENPYPRWIGVPRAREAGSLNAHLRQQLPFAPFHPLGKGGDIDILIAGCGTGQESIESAQQFPASRVLAIDLSRSSLGYARRKTDEAGVTNVDYTQGDILQLW